MERDCAGASPGYHPRTVERHALDARNGVGSHRRLCRIEYPIGSRTPSRAPGRRLPVLLTYGDENGKLVALSAEPCQWLCCSEWPPSGVVPRSSSRPAVSVMRYRLAKFTAPVRKLWDRLTGSDASATAHTRIVTLLAIHPGAA
jgi:hypothetical protein